MPTAPIRNEFFSGGVVTIKDPTQLEPGELQQADECVYRLHESALYSAPGRTVFNSDTIQDASATTCPVKGMAYLAFQGTQVDRLVVLAGSDNDNGALYSTPFTTIAGSATFTRLTGLGQVTSCSVTTAGGSPANRTITCSNPSFSSAFVGARVIGGGIPANTYVESFTDTTHVVMNNAANAIKTNETLVFDFGIPLTPIDKGTETLDTVQWDGVYFALGFGTIQRLYYRTISFIKNDGTSPTLGDIFVGRPAGLLAVIQQPSVGVNTTGGGAGNGWSAVLGNGYYWFLTTEVYNPDQPDEIEGTYAPVDATGKNLNPVPALITDFNKNTITVTRPPQINDGNPDAAHGRISTHWRIYMSPKQTDGTTIPDLSTFRLIGTYSMFQSDGTPNLSVTLADSNVTRSGYPSSKVSVSGRNEWTNPNFLLNAPDNLYALSRSNVNVDTGRGENIAGINQLTSYVFTGTDGSFSGLTVVGVQVTVHGYVVDGSIGDGTCTATLQTTSKKSSTLLFHLVTNYNAGQFVSIGGSQDTLGVNWVAADFAAAGGFYVTLEKPASTGENSSLGIDSVLVQVFYTGTSINLNGKPFRVITYQDQLGNTLTLPAAFPPPQASTGDVFQGSVVVNDTSMVNALRYSLPGQPEMFPNPYILKFNNRRKDKITLVRRLGQVLVVGMTETIERVNYLPTEVDIDFREGIAHETIATDHGIVSPLAATIFTMPGGGPMLAYLAYNGLHVTDGVTTRFLNTDFNLSQVIDPAYITKAVLRTYSKENWLVLYYTPVGSTKNTRAIVYSYDQPKDTGMLRAVGPISVGARSAADAALNGTPILLTGHHSGGKIYTEDQGNVLPNGYTDGVATVVGSPNILTRRYYPAGVDRNARVERIYVQHTASGSQATVISSVLLTTSTTITASTPGAYTVLTAGMRAVSDNLPGDAIIISIDGPGNTLVLSQKPLTAGTVNVTFDTGTLGVTVRRQNIGEAPTDTDTTYGTTFFGGSMVFHNDNAGQAIEVRIHKVRLPSGTFINLGVPMKLQYIGVDVADAGKEQHRSGN